MNKTSALLLIAALVSPATFAKDTLPKDEIGPFGPIPVALLEAHFNQCVEDNKSIGMALVGNYCQCEPILSDPDISRLYAVSRWGKVS